ncbi:membrane bound hydrolase [Bacillus sp. 1NLA3E]|nr:membrane bound hydrolase [Bacillus sp. 1NLA3E]
MRKILAFLALLFIVSILIIFGGETQSLSGTFLESLVGFLTHPVVITILLAIASLGFVMELFSPGFGFPGLVGLTALVLFFYGHLVAGLAGFETILLFVLGIGLIILELFVPGGIIGVLGTLSIITSLLLASDNMINMGISILIAIGLSIIVAILMVKVYGKKMRLFNKIILTDSTNTENGYVSNLNRTDLLGKAGITFTALRPSGTVLIDDERVDVVSEGDFIVKGKQVKVVKVEGSRIVVRECNSTSKEELKL